MRTLTVFTPAYNRKHTIYRTFESLTRQTCNDFQWLIIDDGSTDGTRAWVESLGEKVSLQGPSFNWMGVPSGSEDSNHFIIAPVWNGKELPFLIEYIYKPNGGLYTGYNTAYATIQTELCVCIDSDDYMPDNAVERILEIWNGRKKITQEEVCGIVGLDFNVVDKKPIGGSFDEEVKLAYFQDLRHPGDTKQVMRTELMRKVAPQIGFRGERDFNPYYMLMQVCDMLPIIVSNDNFCWVEYQTTGDSMSAGIWKQYVRSPHSYAKYRIMQMKMKHGNNLKSRMRLCIHYISSCILTKDAQWVKNSPYKFMTVLLAPLGALFTCLVKWKNR